MMDDANRIDAGPRKHQGYLDTPANIRRDMTRFIEWLRIKNEEAITRWNKKHDEANF